MGKKAEKKTAKKSEKKAEKKNEKIMQHLLPSVDKRYLLTTSQMAEFVARGFLRFDEMVPNAINQAVMAEFDAGTTQAAPAGTPLSLCYPEPSAVGQMLRMPELQGIIYSLVGPDPLFDHHAIHVRQPNEGKAQGMHGDSIIDTRLHFDIQIMYFPHDVPLEMGGTLVLSWQPIPAHQRDGYCPLSKFQGANPDGLQGWLDLGFAPRYLALWTSEPNRPEALYVQGATESARASISPVEYRRSRATDRQQQGDLYA